MRYLFISDFHLGSPLFSNEYELIKILTGGYDKVFLVGDIIDIEEDDINSIVCRYKILIDTINRIKNVIFIKGNHDPEIGVLVGVFPNAEITNKYVDHFGVVVHGDEFDNFIGTLMYKISLKAFYVCERIGINTKMILRNVCACLLSLINGKSINDLLFNYEIDIVDKYCCNFDNIIMGHSHLPKIVNCNNCKYVNCGDWIYNKTYVEYVDGEFKLLGV